MNNDVPGRAAIESALELASAAPSVHNSQPWRWRLDNGVLDLYADAQRILARSDPDGRDLYVSCGIALHHTRIACAALGWRTTVDRLPDPTNPLHIASMTFVQRRALTHEIALAGAIPKRRSDRRWYGSWAVPEAHLSVLTKQAAAEGVIVDHAPMSAVFRRALVAAAESHSHDQAYQIEIAAWSGTDRIVDGVPADNVPAPERPSPSHVPMPNRAFSQTGLAQPTHARASDDAGALLILGTPGDDRACQVRAGEAASAVLLEATSLGLATCAFTEPLEIAESRRIIQRSVSTTHCFPQLIVRTGWAPTNAAPIPSTPRRELSDMVDGLDTLPAGAGAHQNGTACL